MSELGTPAWTARHGSKPDPKHFRPVVAYEHVRVKPPSTMGFWTSTYDERFGSGWVQWCLGEEFECDRAKPEFPLWTLEPDPVARIYTIDTYADLRRLCRLYGRTYTFGEGNPHGPWHDTYPDWSLVAEAYDGVHLTDEGQGQTRLSRPLNLYGWDCECTLWFRWMFGNVRDLGVVRCEDRYAEEAA